MWVWLIFLWFWMCALICLGMCASLWLGMCASMYQGMCAFIWLRMCAFVWLQKLRTWHHMFSNMTPQYDSKYSAIWIQISANMTYNVRPIFRMSYFLLNIMFLSSISRYLWFFRISPFFEYPGFSKFPVFPDFSKCPILIVQNMYFPNFQWYDSKIMH